MLKKNKIIGFLICLSCLCTSPIRAQYSKINERVNHLPNFDKKFLHYGYYVGIIAYDFKFNYIKNYYSEFQYKDIVVTKNAGFNVGLVGSLRINEFLNLRLEPGLYYSERELYYPEYIEFTSESDRLRELKSTYIHIPLILKMSTRRINNVRPFLLAGISTDFNLSSNEKNIDDNFSNEFRTITQSYNYEIGFGVDIYLYYFKFSPSIRGIFSLQNELVPDGRSELLPDGNPNSPWTGKILGMLSRGIAINFTFE